MIAHLFFTFFTRNLDELDEYIIVFQILQPQDAQIWIS